MDRARARQFALHRPAGGSDVRVPARRRQRAGKIEGTALNVHAIANLMSNLQKTGYFKSVEMTESIQDDKSVAENIQAFTFMITCEVNKTTAPPPAQKS